MAVKKVSGANMTPIQERFVQEYLIDCNATQAYIRAGGSKNGAGVSGHNLLKVPKISAAVKSKQKSLADKLGITTESVLREMKSIAFSNIEDYITVGEDGTASVDLSAMSREQAAAVSSLTTKSYFDQHLDARVNETTVKLPDKKAALETLGRHIGIRGFGTSKLELTGKDGGPVKIDNIANLTTTQLEAIATANIEETEE